MNYNLINPRDYRLTEFEQVLFNRNIDLSNIKEFKNPTDNQMNSPLLLDNIKEGAQLLVSHIAQDHEIFIQVDSDCDGYTSAAILINYLNKLFPAFAQSKISYRLHDEKLHGLLVDTIPEGVRLVILPDASSNDYEQHKIMKARGIDVLVIDHHEAEKTSKFACVINNQLCDYPNKDLSGAGVVYKFCQYIDSLLGVNNADLFADLATVGIIADVEPLVDLETRAIIIKGMNGFRNPLLRHIKEKDDFHFDGKDLTPFNIAWYIAPLINAMTRSGTDSEKLVVFESMIDFLAYRQVPSTKRGCTGQVETRVEQAYRTCTNVKNRQTKARDAAMIAVRQTIERDDLTKNKILAVRLDPKYAADKNLTGLIANSLLDEYCRPILILNEKKKKVITENGEEEKIFWQGSGRGYDKGDLGNLREMLEKSGLVEFAQGHASAFGISIPVENYDALVEYVNEQYKDFDCAPSYKVDLIWKGNNEISSSSIENISKEEKIWGRGVEDPLIVLEGFKVFGSKMKITGLEKSRPTLTIYLDDGSSIVKYGSSQEEYEKLFSQKGYVEINAVGTCGRSFWGAPQFNLKDYEIIRKVDYYF